MVTSKSKKYLFIMTSFALFALIAGCYRSKKHDSDIQTDDVHGEPRYDSDFLENGIDSATDQIELDNAEMVDGIEPNCLPMDARAVGQCEMTLDGFKWNGTNCVPLGSGCECQGEDCNRLFSSLEECIDNKLICYGDYCRPQQIALDMCINECPMRETGYLWDGKNCIEFSACGCTGQDCEKLYSSQEECEILHQSCDSTLCIKTGGMWFSEKAGLCGFTCGMPAPIDCLQPEGSCNCGAGKTFLSPEGCVDDETCGMRELCLATGGRFYPASECFCGFECGSPLPCGACLDSCDCGPGRNYLEGSGCVTDENCPPATDEQICTFTGGIWHEDDSCGNYHCGIPNYMEPCIAPGCDCGFLSNFDPETGCHYDASCVDKYEGQDCWGYGHSSSCREGLVCCPFISPGGVARCENPCCPSEDGCQEDGCFIVP